ncbi:YdcF family protein [Peribacillus sp. SCS-26]|uniref:YdcF family protein n=1 Tax=Paraperibacillus marinus TaxID=3115295 RepID=UPI003906817A
MLISELDSENLTDSQMDRLLFKNMKDDNRNGDCIFVAGSRKAVHYRLPKAVQLYESGRAGKILFSGGVTWPGDEFPEAVCLKNRAEALGIPEKDILIEDKSLHTKENVLASLLVLDREFHLHTIGRLIVVTAAFHMRRLHITMKTYMPGWISYTLCPVHDSTSKNWKTSETGRMRVEAESKKLISYVKMGALSDENIDL